MKTTIDQADPLFRRAKKLAAKRGITFRQVVEEALRTALEQEDRKAPRAKQVRMPTFGGRGLQPGLSWRDWGTIRALAYEGRGG